MKTQLILSALLLVVVYKDHFSVHGQDDSTQSPDVTQFSSICSCPNLTVEQQDTDIQTTFSQLQPLFVNFYPNSYKYVNLDNVCYTGFPLPDDPTTFINYISYVYCDGTNKIESYITSQDTAGIFLKGTANCNLADIVFTSTEDDDSSDPCSTDTFYVYSCFLSGECSTQDSSVLPVYGLTTSYQPLDPSCLPEVEATIAMQGLPSQDYITLPMSLPSQCVFGQVSRIVPAGQRFLTAIGVTYTTCATYL